MPDSTLIEIIEALRDQLATTLTPLIPGLQVERGLVPNPTPPAIDIFPADPFQAPLAFGIGTQEIFLTVRARVNTPDHEGAQETLLDLVDPRAATSLTSAIEEDPSLGDTVEDAAVADGPTGYAYYEGPPGSVGATYLGCSWTVRITP